MQGVLVTSMVTAAFVHAVQETTRRASRQGEGQAASRVAAANLELAETE
jgi:hypothetical protein